MLFFASFQELVALQYFIYPWLKSFKPKSVSFVIWMPKVTSSQEQTRSYMLENLTWVRSRNNDAIKSLIHNHLILFSQLSKGQVRDNSFVEWQHGKEIV